ncbi:MAG: alpha-glucosidase, partial [Mycobacterium sp.]|nr:alpha-glucosidase [Mycobacterium sp.]
TVRGRDGCRIPMPWRGDTPPFGFSASADTWLPIPAEWESLTVENQLLDPDSTLSFFERALEIRRSHPGFAGEAIEWLQARRDTLAFARGDHGLRCVLNAGKQSIPLPDGEPILTSTPLVDGKLPANAAAWLVSSSEPRG